MYLARHACSRNSEQNVRLPRSERNVRLPRSEQNVRLRHSERNVRLPRSEQNVRLPRSERNVRLPRSDRNHRDRANLVVRKAEAAEVHRDRSGAKARIDAETKTADTSNYSSSASFSRDASLVSSHAINAMLPAAIKARITAAYGRIALISVS